ncbi:hypothetical protein SBADM41S_06549 [Streptomyces badius]
MALDAPKASPASAAPGTPGDACVITARLAAETPLADP